MSYRIVFTNRAVKDIESLEPSIRRRIGEKLREYAENPFVYARKLSDPKIGTFRFRIGDYRVIFDIDGDTIVVLRVGHRKKIYR